MTNAVYGQSYHLSDGRVAIVSSFFAIKNSNRCPSEKMLSPPLHSAFVFLIHPIPLATFFVSPCRGQLSHDQYRIVSCEDTLI